MSADAHHMTAPHPEGLGAPMKNCLEDAGVTDEVDHINMHGTSTPLGDIAESNAIANYWRARLRYSDQFYKVNDRSPLGAAVLLKLLLLTYHYPRYCSANHQSFY
jgi:3-oxoacyl-(acyl-carrier-protein) synthase